MSFDIFVSSFENGLPSPVSTATILDAFIAIPTAAETDCIVLRFDEQHDQSYLFMDMDAEVQVGFTINRPSSDGRLYEALFALLKRPGLVLYMPADAPPLVGATETVEHLPIDLVESLGVPVVLRNGAEIVDWIQKA